jgi:hypothetical protein
MSIVKSNPMLPEEVDQLVDYYDELTGDEQRLIDTILEMRKDEHRANGKIKRLEAAAAWKPFPRTLPSSPGIYMVRCAGYLPASARWHPNVGWLAENERVVTGWCEMPHEETVLTLTPQEGTP